MRNLLSKLSISNITNRIRINLQQLEFRWLTKQFSQLKLMEVVKWKEFNYPIYNELFLKFLNSKSHEGLVTGQQLMFITGSQKIGKSKFIRQNVEKFKNKKKDIKYKMPEGQQEHERYYLPPETIIELQKLKFANQHHILVHIVVPESLSFYALLHIIENQIIQKIVAKSEEIVNLIDSEILLDIFKCSFADEYIEIYAKDYVLGLLLDLEEQLVSPQAKIGLNKIYDEFMTAKFQGKLIFTDIYPRIIKVLNQESKNLIETSIRFLLGILKKIEFQYRPQVYTYSYYRTGIQTTNFLFDILNFLTGLHKLNAEKVKQFYYKKPTAQSNNQIQLEQKNYIYKGNHIDTVVIFEDLFKAVCSNDINFLNWFDHIVLRTVKQSNLRTHFPIVIELKHTQQIRQISRLGRIPYQNPLIVDLHGYRNSCWAQSNLLDIFTIKQLKLLYPLLGHHPKTWEEVIKQFEDKQFTLEKLKKGEAKFIKKQELILENKINQLYTSPKLIQFLDDGSLKYRILQQMKIFIKTKGLIDTAEYSTIQFVIENEVSEVMVEVGISYPSYYYDFYILARGTFQFSMKSMSNKMLNTKMQKFKFWWWFHRNTKISMRQIILNYKRDSYYQLRKKMFLQQQRPELHHRQMFYGSAVYEKQFYDTFRRVPQYIN